MTIDVQKKMYHLAFSFDEPRPGVITLPAVDEDEAKKMLLEMAKNMRNVEVHEIIDASTVPSLQAMIDKQAQREADAIAKEEQDVEVEKKVLN